MMRAQLALAFCLNNCDVLFESRISKNYNVYKQEKGRICVKDCCTKTRTIPLLS